MQRGRIEMQGSLHSVRESADSGRDDRVLLARGCRLLPTPYSLFPAVLVEELEVLAWLEADGLAGGDGDLGAGAGVAADAGLAGLDGEDAEAAELDAVAFGEGALHGFEDGVDGGLGLDAREPGAFDDPENEVLLDHGWVAFLVRSMVGCSVLVR